MDTNIAAFLIVIAGLALLFQRASALAIRLDRLARLEAKVDALLRHQGIEFDPLAGVPSQVREAVERGERILAIKRLREATGAGLKEAKEQVDELWRRRRTM